MANTKNIQNANKVSLGVDENSLPLSPDETPKTSASDLISQKIRRAVESVVGSDSSGSTLSSASTQVTTPEVSSEGEDVPDFSFNQITVDDGRVNAKGTIYLRAIGGDTSMGRTAGWGFTIRDGQIILVGDLNHSIRELDADILRCLQRELGDAYNCTLAEGGRISVKGRISVQGRHKPSPSKSLNGQRPAPTSGNVENERSIRIGNMRVNEYGQVNAEGTFDGLRGQTAFRIEAGIIKAIDARGRQIPLGSRQRNEIITALEGRFENAYRFRYVQGRLLANEAVRKLDLDEKTVDTETVVAEEISPPLSPEGTADLVRGAIQDTLRGELDQVLSLDPADFHPDVFVHAFMIQLSRDYEGLVEEANELTAGVNARADELNREINAARASHSIRRLERMNLTNRLTRETLGLRTDELGAQLTDAALALANPANLRMRIAGYVGEEIARETRNSGAGGNRLRNLSRVNEFLFGHNDLPVFDTGANLPGRIAEAAHCLIDAPRRFNPEDGEIIGNYREAMEEIINYRRLGQRLGRARDAVTEGSRNTWDRTRNGADRVRTWNRERRERKQAAYDALPQAEKDRLAARKDTAWKWVKGGSVAVAGLGLGAVAGTGILAGGALVLGAKTIRSGWRGLKENKWFLPKLGRTVATPATMAIRGLSAVASRTAQGFIWGTAGTKPKGFFKNVWYRGKQAVLGATGAFAGFAGGMVEGGADMGLDFLGVNKGSVELIKDGWALARSLRPGAPKHEFEGYGKYGEGAIGGGVLGLAAGLVGIGKGLVYDGPRDFFGIESLAPKAAEGAEANPEKANAWTKFRDFFFPGARENGEFFGDGKRLMKAIENLRKDGQFSAEGFEELTDSLVDFFNLEKKGKLFGVAGYAAKFLAKKLLPHASPEVELAYDALWGNMKKLKTPAGRNSFFGSLSMDSVRSATRYLREPALFEAGLKSDANKTAIQGQIEAFFGDKGPLTATELAGKISAVRGKIGARADLKAVNHGRYDDFEGVLVRIGETLTDARLQELYFGITKAQTVLDYDTFGDKVMELCADPNHGPAAVLGRLQMVPAFESKFRALLNPQLLERRLESVSGITVIRGLLRNLFDLEEGEVLNEADLGQRRTDIMGAFGDVSGLAEPLRNKFTALGARLGEIVANVIPHLDTVYGETLDIAYDHFADTMESVTGSARARLFALTYNRRKFRNTFNLATNPADLAEAIEHGGDELKAAQAEIREFVGTRDGKVSLARLTETLTHYRAHFEPLRGDARVGVACTTFLEDLQAVQDTLTQDNNLGRLFRAGGVHYEEFGRQLMGLDDDQGRLAFLNSFRNGRFISEFGLLLDTETMTPPINISVLSAVQSQVSRLTGLSLTNITAPAVRTIFAEMIRIMEEVITNRRMPAEIRGKASDLVQNLTEINNHLLAQGTIDKIKVGRQAA
ncbi:MAG: hypothetical protein WC846_03655 [Candidatus Gracilibacteria bacterium]|jgi:hypothetical protein